MSEKIKKIKKKRMTEMTIDIEVLALICKEPDRWHLGVVQGGYCLILDKDEEGYLLGGIRDFDYDEFLSVQEELSPDKYR